MAEIKKLSAEAARNDIEAFIDIIIDAVDKGASINFMPPMQRDQAVWFWNKAFKSVEADEIILFGAYVDGKLAGTVQIEPAWQPNGAHRVEIMKLIVHSDYRRQGIAMQLMQAAEDATREIGRDLIILDTTKESAGYYVYLKAGYSIAGEVPGFALNPEGRDATVYFYRQLNI